MPVYITDKDAFEKMVTIEGQRWAKDQENFGDCSFAAFVRAYEDAQEQIAQYPEHLRKEMADWGLSTPSGMATIYGDGGWNRYAVRSSGEILFLERQSRTPRHTQLARELGFTVR